MRVGQALVNMLAEDITPSKIMTKAAFENAIVTVMALGGSTNAVLHLIAMARAAHVDITLDDFQRISDKVPFIADLKPSGKYAMEDLHNVGGVPAVLKLLLREGFIEGDCLTVTGRTLAENLDALPDLTPGQDVVVPFSTYSAPTLLCVVVAERA
eukprot:m.954016 g.954016  ORF g.954016 m.954016 type:complete len:155 (-) comp23871_c1_seq27:4477-4941(-)